MAQSIVIEQGNRQLQDVTKVKPDTRVNQKAIIEYPATDLVNGMVQETFEEDGVTFYNPDAYVNPDEASEESGS